jgi:putative ABC transport system permease protein
VNRGSIWYNIAFTAKNKASIADVQAEFIRVINEANTAEDARYDIPAWQKRSVKESSAFGGSDNLISIIGVLILMLIPAFNILSLNVSKSYERSEEIAVRKAFGAPLRTIFGQLFFENILLTLMGAIVGMCLTPLALYGIDQMILRITAMMPMMLALQFDWVTVFLVAGPCVLVFSFLSGSIPAWITAKRDIVNVLKGEAK